MAESKYQVKMRRKAQRLEEKGRYEDALQIYRDLDLFSEEGRVLVRLERREEAAKAYLKAENWLYAMSLSALAEDTKGVSEALGRARQLDENEDVVRGLLADTVREVADAIGVETAMRMMLDRAPHLGEDQLTWLLMDLAEDAEEAGLFDLLGEVQIQEHKMVDRAASPRFNRDGGWREIITFLRGDNVEKALELFEECWGRSPSLELRGADEFGDTFGTGWSLRTPDVDQAKRLRSLPQAQTFYARFLENLCETGDVGRLRPCVELGRSLCDDWRPWSNCPSKLQKRCISVLIESIPFLRSSAGEHEFSNQGIYANCLSSVCTLDDLIHEMLEGARVLEDQVITKLRSLEQWGVVLGALIVSYERYDEALRLLDEIPLSVLFPEADSETDAQEAQRRLREQILWKKKVASTAGSSDPKEAHGPTTAELDQMLALGEITREEYDTMKQERSEGQGRDSDG